MIVQQKRYWNLNIYLRTLFYFIFNWSVYPLISSTKSGPPPELDSPGLSNFNVILNISFKEKFNQVNYLWALFGPFLLVWATAMTKKFFYCSLSDQAPLVAGTGIEDGDDELHLFGVWIWIWGWTTTGTPITIKGQGSVKPRGPNAMEDTMIHWYIWQLVELQPHQC